MSPAGHTVRVVRGHPTDAELSALLTVLLARARPVDRPRTGRAPLATRWATGWAAQGFPGWAA
ncbi:acyl-CoA carboxylase epsilon subunit [Streptomyces sp. CWNU-52B]|uniref:acyl-CoA carboxylase epsilon subunit n=1 Tax=unclassified Streptomyces TaxID=2593676 RepID=UPI0039C4DF92